MASPIYGPRRLERKIQTRLPECKRFVAELWGAQESEINPSKINLHAGHATESPTTIAKANAPAKELNFYGSYFSSPFRYQAHSVDSILVHELTHLATCERFSGMAPMTRQIIVEGLARFSEHRYESSLTLSGRLRLMHAAIMDSAIKDMCFYLNVTTSFSKIIQKNKERPPKDFRISPYENGFWFIDALVSNGVQPKELLGHLAASPPSFVEIFFPTDYLARLKIEPCLPILKNSDAVGRSEIPEWINRVVFVAFHRYAKGDLWPYSREHSLSDPYNSGWNYLKYRAPVLSCTPGDLFNAFMVLIKYPFRAAMGALQEFLKSIRGPKEPVPAQESFLAHSFEYDNMGLVFMDSVVAKFGAAAAEYLAEYPPTKLEHIFDPDVYIKEVEILLQSD